MTPQPTRLKPLKGDASRIFKLCLEKDPKTALQGLALAAALGAPMEGVLADVKVGADGNLERGKRFTAKDKSQAILDALLLQQLALAPKGSPEAKLRNAITTLDCTVPVVPDLSTFAGVKKLKMTFSGTFKGEHLGGLGSLPKLKSLTLSTGTVMYGQDRATLGSLNGLEAPMLEELNASFLDLFDIEALYGCHKLKRVEVRGNRRLTSIDSLKPSAGSLEVLDIGYCAALSSLKALREATRLRSLDMGRVENVAELSDLKKLTSLNSIELSGCKGLTSFKGLPLTRLNDFNRVPDTLSDSLFLNDLKALTSLNHMPPLAPEIGEFSLNRAVLLTDLSDLAKSAGSLRKLSLNQVGITDLDALASLVNLENLEVTGCPELIDATALAKLEKLSAVRLTDCKKLARMPDAWKSSVRSLVLTGCHALEPIKALPPGIDAKTIEIHDRKLLPRAKPMKALKSDVGALWKLLSSREIPNILMGLELSAGLEADDFHTLVAGVSVSEGKLLRGKRFSGTGPAQPFLDLALFGLMARAPEGSALPKLRAQVTELDLTLISQAHPLDGCTGLTQLSLQIGGDVTPDLTGFGLMPKLTKLKVVGPRGWRTSAALLSLNGLQAPALTEVDLSGSRIVDLSALRYSPRITLLNLSDNPELIDLSALEACAESLIELDLRRCKQVGNLEVLKTATKLKSIDLHECDGLISVQPLASCESLETLTLQRCANLRSLEGLAQLPLQPYKSYDGFTSFSLDGCSALTSLAHLPAMGENLQRLSVNDCTALKNLDGLRDFPSLIAFSANSSGLSDLNGLCAMPALTSLSLENCPQLKDATPIGQLEKLEQVDLKNSAVTTLPQAWRGPLSEMQIKGCKDLTALGVLPVTLRNLQARGCTMLTSLQGLQACSVLEVVEVPIALVDASAMKGLPTITISFDVNELGKPAAKGELVALPQTFIDAINNLSAVRLQLRGPSGGWYGSRVFDLSCLSQFTSVISLSFNEFDFQCPIEELAWLVPMKDLQNLVFYPRGNMSNFLNGGVYDSEKKVKMLQQRICQEAKIKLPLHLIA